ncbi:glycosyltransferase family 2 protein [Mesorhizobium marinum]|uniref:glycosyltransferase family 2 protein n=1 Tax=Mesorhizobium marinum TaxID=3228790 RepID=UPI0034662344
MAALASRNGTDFQTELLVSGLVTEADFVRALAEELQVGHLLAVDPDRLIVSDELATACLRRRSWHVPFKLAGKDGAASYLIVPDGVGLSRLGRLIADRPRLRDRLKLVAPGAMRAALLLRVREALTRHAISSLFDRYPEQSARIVANAWQGLVVGAFLATLPVAFWLAPGDTWFALHIVFSVIFLTCVALRFAALTAVRGTHRQLVPEARGRMPVYSVLVALHREADVVSELVVALQRIDWPKSRLEIKLVCEMDDRATLGALRAISLPPNMEVVEVPVAGPRTKPKALAYALPLTRGEFVALYDAEDHPDPRQLLHVWAKFNESPPEVACLQAPLEIANRGAGILARMFAFEYAGLFRAMLPWLSARRLVLPLGGTSNHFRRSALDEVGGWDPFNVTEDADLGMRLARFGYRTETIDCPTWEQAPETIATWLPQRTRWLKGWMQTWLVHMRQPVRLLRQLGPGSFLVGQILFGGMVLSALAHPFLLGTGLILAIEIALDRPTSRWKSTLLTIDIVNVACGYLSFLLLGWQVLKVREKLGFWKVVLFTPVYWMMMSIAAWRAVWQLCREPYLWEKTPHQPMRRTRPPNPAGALVLAR